MDKCFRKMGASGETKNVELEPVSKNNEPHSGRSIVEERMSN
jgi:hypothetical protein